MSPAGGPSPRLPGEPATFLRETRLLAPLAEEPRLLAELRRLRSRFSAGSASVVNPRVGGSHGDMAQALALAVAEHARLGVPTFFRQKSNVRPITAGLLTEEL